MSNCPFCGTHKVSKTFNFNEYTCDLCECDYKHTSDGVRIFQEGSWASFCESIVKEVSEKSDATVVNLVSKTMRGFSKRSPSEVDLVIEALSTIAGTLNNEMKVGFRGKRDFLTMVEQLDTVIKAAQTLHKRQNDIGIKIKLSEEVLDWFKGDGESDMKEGAMSELDIVAQEAIESLGEKAAEDEAVISFVQQNYPDDVEHINIILQAVHDKVQGGDMEGGGEYDESTNSEVKEEEDPFAAEGDNAGGEAAPAEGGDVEGDVEGDTGGEDPFAAEGGDAVGDEGGDMGGGDAIADVQDAAETVQDKFKRLETKIDDLLNKVETLNGGESTDSTEGDTAGEDPFAPEGDSTEGESQEPANGDEGSEDGGAAPTEGEKSSSDNFDPFAESVIREAKRSSKKIGVVTTRGDETKASYQRKQSAAEAHKETEEDGEDRTDMNAEVEEEDIPFTEGPAKQMKKIKDTNSTAPGSIEKPTGTVSYREGFNGFRSGDEVIIESSNDTWSILSINSNIFTLGRGKTTTKIDIFKESIRHVDSRLEWQKTTELMGESKKRWSQIENNYSTENETKVTGVIGLGGGNRIGGEKFGKTEKLSEATKIEMIETLAADRKDIYKYVKDNAIHRLAREVAIQRVCEKFTNPIEEINNIVDDAVLSEDTAQVETINSQYGYAAAPIGENALRQAFQRGWQSVVESEAKEAKPAKKVVAESRGMGYYRTNEDSLIDQLGRTAADRLSGK